MFRSVKNVAKSVVKKHPLVGAGAMLVGAVAIVEAGLNVFKPKTSTAQSVQKAGS